MANADPQEVVLRHQGLAILGRLIARRHVQTQRGFETENEVDPSRGGSEDGQATAIPPTG